jgi:O-antigen ligase/tetratricopeptide (TPR) repeat protein
MNLKPIVRWITLAALFLIPVLPLLVANDMFFPFITGKNFWFRILTEVAFVGWAILALSDKKYRPNFSWTFVIFAAFVVWMAIADAFAVNPDKAFWSNFERMEGWVGLVHFFLFFVVLGSMMSAEKLWRKWWGAFVAVSAIICGYSILQAMHVLAIHQGSTRVDATLGNSAYLAAYLLFAFAATLWLALKTNAKHVWLRYAFYALAVLQVVILFYTETRGAILGLVGAAILALWLWRSESLGKKWNSLALGLGRATVEALLIVAVLIGAFFAFRHEPWVQKVPALGRIATISLADKETTARFHIWHMAWNGFVERPVTGWGQEGFNYVFNKYFEPALYGQEPWFDRAHDIYLDWLTAGGAPGFILFIALLISAGLAFWRAEYSRTERTLFIAVVAAYAFQGIFVFDNLLSYLPLMAVLAMAHSVSSRPFKQAHAWKEISTSSFSTVAVPVAVVVLACAIWFINVPSMNTAKHLIHAISPSQDVKQNIEAFKQSYADHSFADQEITEQLLSFMNSVVASPNIPTGDKQAVATYALTQASDLVKKIPNDARVRMEFAYSLRAVGDMKDALDQVKVAEQLSPNKQTNYMEEGIEQWQAGNVAAARDAFYKAYNLDTSFVVFAAYAASGDIAAGDLQKGKKLLVDKLGTTTPDVDLLVVAYYMAKDFPDLIAVLRNYVKDQNGSAESRFKLAAALADAGNVAAARMEVQQAIKDHPEAANEGAAYLQKINGSPAAK